MLARPGPESTRSQLTWPNLARRKRRRSTWSSSRGAKSAWPPSDGTTRYPCPSGIMRASPRPVPAAISAMLPPGLGVPTWRTKNFSGGSARTPWAAASRSLTSLAGAFVAAARRRSWRSQEERLHGALEALDLAARQDRLADDGHALHGIENGQDGLGAPDVAGEN